MRRPRKGMKRHAGSERASGPAGRLLCLSFPRKRESRIPHRRGTEDTEGIRRFSRRDAETAGVDPFGIVDAQKRICVDALNAMR
jgi:hypothetical protein